ncbi:putative aldehyde dehydrogenase FUS7 [Colletotrichum fructicola]|uniref:aldehyde dehydrogenase (NAD(+)) n=1 Tax=Colletotrichum fructicola (strain Nara gc5) TaxID=1213859 RepID=A0A7J6IPR0_COLFN|nr:putative aldehyde dehydrogenase [Colletotrichum fructicola]KAF4478265.1 putative aldehyde dehydrogenase FUS7 [Colletotrichum fructicola Nara gc5]KAF4822632.1 putative aldehyde dehydrogenase FUS7 [Colletotrichum siamense]KAI8163072.1 putative aldehyde dehydrogenase [Colletotrichum sp. SAR 10_71]KAI8200674.1 putative aldehyde dehydrogenase [Colletotrichum sp. SAR 10_70]KAI8239062.1 putative aldehyde dehydrogenase [Colletotrichum sp. SAR 10_96]KAI8279046.1 putative aldehyde dehydrogenase [Col
MAANGTSKLDFTKFYNVINGKLETTPKTRHGLNPSTLEPLAEVPLSTAEDVDRAVQAARAAQEAWAETPYEERKKAVAKLGDLMEENLNEFAVMLSKEQGKPIGFAQFEISEAIKHFRGVPTLPFPEEVVSDDPDRRVITRYVPLGVAVGIVPWNFPILLAVGKICPALITGNAFILKPSPFTPYCDLKIVELAQQVFPPGVFQALSGDDNLGPWLTSHPGVDKVSFTGSTATGKRVMESCAKTLKRVTLELGGNDAAIVLPDVDIKAVAPKIVTLALYNSGQVCIAIKRIYIHESIYDELLTEMANVVNSFPVGDGQKEGTMLGPVQNQMQFERVKDLLKDIEEQKHKLAAGSTAPASNGKGYFITPTMVDNPPDNSRIVVEEPFGPVFPVLKWSDEKEVIQRANNTDMGLGASVWSKDLEKAQAIAKKLKAGNVWINTHLELQYDAPFGGHKQSGIGYEYGAGGLKAYCNAQSMFITKA